MPEVSVILPVYNGASFLKEAIDSVLAQTYTDFELLLINDGSTDDSEQIILSYADHRIRYIKNENNKGLIYSLNKGIDEAKGVYIARMDADDIALPERLEKQVQFLKQNKAVGILSCTITFINQNGIDSGFWILDRKSISHNRIASVMPRENCIAHPTVMGEKNLFTRFRYNTNQKHIEDYDLWLRMLNNGVRFEKINEPLLLYRIHTHSVTQTKKVTTFPSLRVANCKKNFLINELKKWRFTYFDFKVAFYMIIDFIISLKKYLLK